MSQLDGEILLKIPALFSVKLAGGNRWQCNCKLRKLVRLFLPSESRQNELISRGNDQSRLHGFVSSAVTINSSKVAAKTEAKGTNILQDEPRCASQLDQIGGYTYDSNREISSTNSMSDVDSVRATMKRRRRRRRSYDNGDDEQEEEVIGITWKNLSKYR